MIPKYASRLIEDFLNQAHTACRPARTWFLKIVSMQMSACVCLCVCVCVCVCVRARMPPRLLINTSGVMYMMWTSCDWLNKLYSCYMAIVVIIVNGHGPRN